MQARSSISRSSTPLTSCLVPSGRLSCHPQSGTKWCEHRSHSGSPEIGNIEQAARDGWLRIEPCTQDELNRANELAGQGAGLIRGELECLGDGRSPQLAHMLA